MSGDIGNVLSKRYYCKEEALIYEQNWILPRAHSLLADILATQGNQEQADEYFNRPYNRL